MSTISAPPSATSALFPKLLGGLAVLLFGLGMFNLPLPPWALEMSKEWGPAFFLLLLLGGGLVRWLPKDAITNFITAHQSQAIAMHAMSVSLKEISGQAGKLDELKELLIEMTLDQKVNAERMQRIERHLLYGQP